MRFNNDNNLFSKI
ncbi:Protein of unknown function [Lactobacillus acidophilus DSM 9126]|nr:Protein of unknown function [Lactobacillus acidophilus DSM 20079 = JCM 1132 = NBRC 13951 = CIP 76.13]CDF69444.1 Protein of unknown function [Lactobacillus acidophilus CIRM-BIA 442]CDF71200.1 Protein of unknown function [Lactobacillus acidophilus CIRM-BIA 445]CDF73028.1 Protein of unknown function [Lactobacillus acidophilus DSM 9126]CDF75019.1 Protein of unknown function [Lactobacillus acidophilus DSM 20242]